MRYSLVVELLLIESKCVLPPHNFQIKVDMYLNMFYEVHYKRATQHVCLLSRVGDVRTNMYIHVKLSEILQCNGTCMLVWWKC